MLVAVLNPFDGTAQFHCRQWYQHLFRVEKHDLDAEATAHIRCSDAHLVNRQSEEDSQPVANRDWPLRAIPHGQDALKGVEAGHHTARLHRQTGAAFDGYTAPENMCCLRESGIDMT